MSGIVRPSGRKLDSHRPPPVAVSNQGNASGAVDPSGLRSGDASSDSDELPYKIPKGWVASPVSSGDGSPKVWFRRCISPMATPYPSRPSPVAHSVTPPPPSPSSSAGSLSSTGSSGDLDLARFIAMSPQPPRAAVQNPPPNSPIEFGVSPAASTDSSDSLNYSSSSSEEIRAPKIRRVLSAPVSSRDRATSASSTPLAAWEKEVR